MYLFRDIVQTTIFEVPVNMLDYSSNEQNAWIERVAIIYCNSKELSRIF